MEKIIEIDSLDELNKVAEAVIESLNGRTVVALDAPMGAGKTTLVSRIAEYLGSEDDVTSPTFAKIRRGSFFYSKIHQNHQILEK